MLKLYPQKNGVPIQTRKLKLGVLLDRPWVPAWAYRALDLAIVDDLAELSLLVFNASAPTRKSWLHQLLGQPSGLLYHGFSWLDAKLFLRNESAVCPKPVQNLLHGAASLAVRPVEQGPFNYLMAADIERIKTLELDVLIQLGFGTLRGDILGVARHGIWAYHDTFGRIRAGHDVGFWEVVDQNPETVITLRSEDGTPDGGATIYKSLFSTFSLSPARNRDRALWAASFILARQLRLLHKSAHSGFPCVTKDIDGLPDELRWEHNPKPTKKPTNMPSNMLTNRVSIQVAARLATRLLAEIWRRASLSQTWYLMYGTHHSVEQPPADLRPVLPPKDRFWADPIVIRADHRTYIFIEEYLYASKKGHISVIEIDAEGKWRPPIPVLERDHHLSFPFVFQWNGRYFMIPESAERNVIDLYECTDFPYTWQWKMSLMENVKAVDSALLYREGKWWLFTGIAQNAAAFPEVQLHLFWSHNLLSQDWISHPCNPIVSDTRRARLAGRVFEREGKIFRPSQDCSRTYGFGYDLNEITVLSDEDYREKQIWSVRPVEGSKMQATHSFAWEGDLVVADAMVFRRKPLWSRA